MPGRGMLEETDDDPDSDSPEGYEDMTEKQRKDLERQITETIKGLTELRSALAKVTYPGDVWTTCIGKVRRLERDLVRLEKRK